MYFFSIESNSLIPHTTNRQPAYLIVEVIQDAINRVIINSVVAFSFSNQGENGTLGHYRFLKVRTLLGKVGIERLPPEQEVVSSNLSGRTK